MVRSKIIISALLLPVLLISSIACAGPFDKLKLPKAKLPDLDIPGVEALTGNDDPIISTSISDAQTEVAYLDDYTPKYPTPLDVLRPTKDGIFNLLPGAYEFDAQSYCLHAGTYGPTRGDGYLYAPLKGSKSGIINSVLKQSVNHPEIPQEDVQTLIWAILARTKISDMSPESQKAASKLLSKEQIKDLRGSALDVIPEDELSDILDKVTGPLRQVMEAENSLRERLTDATSSYEELEEIAVLKGSHEKGKGSRDVPAGRWSYCSDGYFVRYMPKGYPETHIEVYVPEKFNIVRDAYGRITSVSDRNGASIELTYSDSIQPLCFSGDLTSAYLFKSVKFIEKLPGGKPEDTIERKWDDVGWTFVGVPNGKASMNWTDEGFGDWVMHYTGWEKRYKGAEKLVKEFDDTTNRVAKSHSVKVVSLSGKILAEMADLSHLRTALIEIIGKDGLDDVWTANQLDRLTNAWQSAFSERVTKINKFEIAALPSAFIGLLGAADGPNGPGGSGGSGGGAGFGPGGGAAAPGDTAQQRLGQSGRPARGCGNDGGDGVSDPVKQALKDHGMDVSDENLDVRESGSGACRLVRLHVPLGEGNKPLPKLACAQAAIASGNVPEGSMESPKKILFISVQQCGDETMVNARTTDLETGEVTGAGRGRSSGTGDSSTASAAGDALGGLGF
ncbi:MAG: hypothetical protein ABFD54_04255 [Armatimonadota bacterium]|nr:hypothetical protein [bacterium]